MSKEYKAILQQANSAICKSDTEEFLSFCTDDIEWMIVGDKTIKGKDALRQWMAAEYVEPPQFTVTNLIAEDTFLTALGEIMVKGDDGKMTPHLYCDVWHFRGDKMAALKAFVIKAEPHS